MQLCTLQIGDRVQLHAALDMVARGAQTGSVVAIDATPPSGPRVRVKLDAWPRPLWFPALFVDLV